MHYYKKVMLPDEKLHFYCSEHWIVYWHAIVLLCLAVAASVLLLIQQPHDAMYQAYIVVILVFLALAVVAFARGYIRRSTTEIAVTDRRVIFKRGLLSRHTAEMNVSKIETVDVEQSITGRVLGYGDVLIRGVGGTFEPLRRVANPLELRSAILVG